MKRGGRRYKFVRNDRNEIVKDADGKPVYSDKLANGSDPSRIAARRAMRAVQYRGLLMLARRSNAYRRKAQRLCEPLQPDSMPKALRQLAAARGQLCRSCLFFSGWRDGCAA
jgi:hypothetical protein